MGVLIIDHRDGQGIDGRAGKKEEFDTVNCGHCSALIALLRRPTEALAVASFDVARNAAVAPHVSTQYTAKFTCRRCRRGLCRMCAEWMATYGYGACDPVEEKVSRFRRLVLGK